MGTGKIGSNRAAGWANAGRQQKTFNGTDSEFFLTRRQIRRDFTQNTGSGLKFLLPMHLPALC